MNMNNLSSNASGERNYLLLPCSLNNMKPIIKHLVEWNEKMNLTAITEKEDVYLKHFYDSSQCGFLF